MSVQDEYGRHVYEPERDEEGNLKTEEHAAGGGNSDEVVQGETLLPVDSEEERTGGYGEAASTDSGESLPPDSYGSTYDSTTYDSTTYDSSTGEPVVEDTVVEEAVVEEAVVEEAVVEEAVVEDSVVEDSVVEEAHPEDVVAAPATDTYDTVGDADDVVAEEPVVAVPVTDSGTDETATADEPSWQELKGLFVDDPAGAVAGAAGKVDAVVAALRDKGESDTENLRLAFRRYQDIFRSLTER